MKTADDPISIVIQFATANPAQFVVLLLSVALLIYLAFKVWGGIKWAIKRWRERDQPGWDIQNRNTPRGRPIDKADKWSIR